MGRIRTAFACAAVGLAFVAHTASAEEPANGAAVGPTSGTTSQSTQPGALSVGPQTGELGVKTEAPPASGGEAPATGPRTGPNTNPGGVGQAPAPSPGDSGPGGPAGSGGPGGAGGPAPTPQIPSDPPGKGGEPEPESTGGVGAVAPVLPDIDPSAMLDMSPVPSVICTEEPGAPRGLLPIYQAASDAYGLGEKGPGILASINLIETRFGELNNVTSSAGAIGWMQFMPPTWDAYGVDADGDGKADPYNPRDAIFSAANYLSASGAPADWYGAIFAYNRADWYVAEVLAKAGCYGSLVGGTLGMTAKLPQLTCEPADRRRQWVPPNYLRAFEEAAGRYELGRQGVWALAAIARLESNFGHNMPPQDMRERGPLGIDPVLWREYGVDGNGDGRVRRANPADSAATLARMIWAQEDLEAGIFQHNQASWYVDIVLDEANQMMQPCDVQQVKWPIALPELSAPDTINWDNLDLLRESQREDILGGALDPRVMKLLAMITQNHQVTISSLRTDHSMVTTSGNVSNHYHGRAIDIAAVDGVSCTDTSTNSPCSLLGRTISLLPLDTRPTELIYCHDLDGPGPAFAMADHCDHIHAGYHGY